MLERLQQSMPCVCYLFISIINLVNLNLYFEGLQMRVFVSALIIGLRVAYLFMLKMNLIHHLNILKTYEKGGSSFTTQIV